MEHRYAEKLVDELTEPSVDTDDGFAVGYLSALVDESSAFIPGETAGIGTRDDCAIGKPVLVLVGGGG
jgi:hypothetical protein